MSSTNPLLGVSIIQKDKVSDTDSLLSPACVNILTVSAKRRRNPRGLCHVKCSFMFCKVCATSASTSMKWRVKRKQYSLFRLTDELNNWLARKITYSLQLLPLPVSHSVSYFFCLLVLIFSFLHTLTSLSKRKEREVGVAGGHYSYVGERITHRKTEIAAGWG